MDKIGNRIREARLRLGLTLEDVGTYVGVGKSTVRKWEQGTIQNMRRDKIKRLSEVLHVSPEYLMGWKEEAAAEGSDLSELDQKVNELAGRLTDQEKQMMIAQMEALIKMRK